MSEQTITVLLVDDHDVVRQGVRTFLELQPDISIVGEAESGQQAIEQVKSHVPDVVLLDLLMPGMDGVAATRQIKIISPRTQIIILTSYHQDEHIFPAIQAGALSYLLKNIKAPQLVDAIRKAAQGEAVLNPRVATRIIQELRNPHGEKVNPFTELTKREMHILQQIANGKNNAEIAAQSHVAIKTVRCHVSNILSKLHLRDRTQVAIYAWREGIVRKES